MSSQTQSPVTTGLTELYFVRHAEPNYANHDDFSRELSEKGLRDRRLVTAFLLRKEIQAVLSSPYKRAVDTVADFAEARRLKITLVDDFRERKIDDAWIADYDAFARRQWSDFSYKLPGGESLGEVQARNLRALNRVLQAYPGMSVAIGSHGTALSTIIHRYEPSFRYEDFETIRGLMPWIVQFTFDGTTLVRLNKIDLFSLPSLSESPVDASSGEQENLRG